jgi:CBS domain-containing protein
VSAPVTQFSTRLRGWLSWAWARCPFVVKVIAVPHDPRAVHVGELAQGDAVTIGADDSAEEILATMRQHQVRRLPVIDGHELVSIVALADVARALNDPEVGTLVEALSVDR